MNLLTQKNIQLPGKDETVFRLSLWGPLSGFLIFLIGLLVGVGFFIGSLLSLSLLGMLLSGLYALMMWGISHILFRTLKANRSPANWLARIGPGGILLKYRSYLHDDSPTEDPIALHLARSEIAHARLFREIFSTSDAGGKRQMLRWFLVIQLNHRYLNPDDIKVFVAHTAPTLAIIVVRSWDTGLYADTEPWSASCSCAGAFICVA